MLPYLFLAFAVAMRFLPHPFSFTPVGAALLYFGARGNRKYFWVPIAALFASDIVLTEFVYRYAFTSDHWFSLLWYVAMIGFGMLIGKSFNALRFVAAALAASVSFFIISNFAVWLAQGMYPMTWDGLRLCYAAGVPFFRADLTGILLFTALFFGLPAIYEALQPNTPIAEQRAKSLRF